MMDLIDRAAALNIPIRREQCDKENADETFINGIETMREWVKQQPTVPAVPLDMLCEWLAQRYEPPYALVEADKLKWPIDFRQQKEIWKVALTKWMEGLDGTD